jgi:catechol 2,3-dioxygenase-like lactoylglutathione lyase family enzyme
MAGILSGQTNRIEMSKKMRYEKTKKSGFHHVCLRVPDLKKTTDFYIYALDATLVAEWGTSGHDDHAYILDLGVGDYLEIFQSAQTFDIGSWQHVAVWTDNIDVSFKRALAYGAKVIAEPAQSDIPTRSGQIVKMKYGFIRAPGGEIVEFIEDR